jgi:ribosome-binding ATPase
MKIAFSGIELPEGKHKYNDSQLTALVNKDKPKKIAPFFAEFVHDDFVHADVIAIPEDDILSLLIFDMEKIEGRLNRITDEYEQKILKTALQYLEDEIPLSECSFTQEELDILTVLALFSLKPVIKIQQDDDINSIISMAIDKGNFMFFYTTGQPESHAWFVNKGTDIVTCAGQIHSDLARGFIRADIVSFEEYFKYYNFKECKSKGIAKLVDKDYIVQPGDIIEIRFSV